MPRNLARLTVCLILALVVVIDLARYLRPDLVALPEISLPVEPGDSLPSNATCQFQYYPPDDIDCSIGDEYATFSKSKGVVTEVGVALEPPVPIGSFIAAWGRPSSVTYGPYLVSVFWRNREALVDHGDFFGPQSATYFIIDHLDAVGASSWHGFSGR